MSYDVTVHNKRTDEVRVLRIETDHGADAQWQALHQMFRSEGWNSARADVAEKVEEEAA